MRLAAPIVIAALSAALLGGCGGSSDDRPDAGSTGLGQDGAPAAPLGAAAHSCETQAVDAEGLRATGVSCSQARRVMHGWQRDSRCAAAASRSACTTRAYRCVATRTDRGVAVSCSRPGRSIAFTGRRN